MVFWHPGTPKMTWSNKPHETRIAIRVSSHICPMEHQNETLQCPMCHDTHGWETFFGNGLTLPIDGNHSLGWWISDSFAEYKKYSCMLLYIYIYTWLKKYNMWHHVQENKETWGTKTAQGLAKGHPCALQISVESLYKGKCFSWVNSQRGFIRP